MVSIGCKVNYRFPRRQLLFRLFLDNIKPSINVVSGRTLCNYLNLCLFKRFLILYLFLMIFAFCLKNFKAHTILIIIHGAPDFYYNIVIPFGYYEIAGRLEMHGFLNLIDLIG